MGIKNNRKYSSVNIYLEVDIYYIPCQDFSTVKEALCDIGRVDRGKCETLSDTV